MLDLIFPFAFTSFFLISLLFGAVDFIGKAYGTYRSLVRQDLTAEQRIIYLLLIWLIPFGWQIYLLLGTERTQRLFADLDIL